MAEFAVFLRGVNVGGITIRMAELRDALSALPVSGVKTLLASGNAVLSTDLDGATLKERIEETLRAAFGYDAWVIVLARQDVEALVRSCPYPSDDPDVHAYVTLSSDPAALDRLVALLDAEGSGGAAEDGTHVRLGPVALAWRCPKGSTLDAPLSKATAKPVFKATTTTRNLRTLQKVEAAFG
ncbi:pyridoxamine 5-phosphate oxidase [Sinomonas atrocyanea]|uniref:Pyridoxamine 5-phosphate oxidase n=1 Tax=Sinomonas atrocyanea TaxID=37927 RepID=A0A127A3B0_9MICC|nr:DUF1697 domain-containing protein [Sinomonas atrocyanea]AMM33095.1 pyridoxamine 5-phosphate oxidase [Sinomonas atrocyanea]GEB65378.1 hypothetical protein SAT01_28260 [Sinomonas atrocyanea]GGG73486.1 hypothetical protein GCM10007172_27580 [Sinomonas atrocyanea]